MATAVADPEAAPASTPKAAGGTPWLAILVAVVVSSAISIGASFVLMRSLLDGVAAKAVAADGEEEAVETEHKPKAPPVYVAMDPAFVANLDAAGETRFLQAQVQLMTRDVKGTERIKPHEPRLRNTLLLLFSQQRPEDVGSRAGVEKLQASALAEVQRVLSDETGEPIVEALYFTSFVVQ